MSAKSWVAAARLRTLPLAFSCIFLGNFLAHSKGSFEWSILIWSLVTTLLYQVLSNYANDYGDGVKGTDDIRQGEKRAVASGEISANAMRNAVWLVAIAAWLCGAWLSYIGTRHTETWVFYLFLLLNTGAVSSAIRYTVGGKAYGYKGYGDVYVLIFFGWIGVMGSFFLQTNLLNFWILLPASSIGMLAMGVLNLNNMRDMKNDVAAGKITVPVRIGLTAAKRYHTLLLFGSLVSMAVYVYFQTETMGAWLFILVSPLIIIQRQKAMKAKSADEFDPLLKPLAIGTLLYALIAGVGINLHSFL